MKSVVQEVRSVSIVAWAALIVTLLVTDKLSTDPVNVSKQLALTAFAFCLIPLLFSKTQDSIFKLKPLQIALTIFLGLTTLSVFLSENPFERGLYGSFGRNTGLLTYFSLAIFLITVSRFTREESFRKIVKYFLIAGVANVAYSLAASFGYDLFTWANPYDSVLGTFGNPNFIGAFMGMFATVLSVQMFSNLRSPKVLLPILIFLVLTIYVIILTNALQGILVAVFGFSMAFFFYIRSFERFVTASYVYLSTLFVGGFVAILGILQRGPLSEFLYKPSVTFRGEYWKTGISMWADNPIFGVGIDSYGQYYRTYRSLTSTVSPGLETTTDAAHNVYIDILAGTGIFGFAGYVLLSIVILMSAIRYIKVFKKFDPIFYSLFLGWCSYQLQSLVSINQIGLAVWGWILGGAVIGYSKIAKIKDLKSIDSTVDLKAKSKKKIKEEVELLDPLILLKVISMFLIGFFIALPPFTNDAKLRTILTGKGSPEELVLLVKNWPRDSNRISRAFVILAQNDKGLEARELAAYTTTILPNDYSAWYALYQIALTDSPEREAYKAKLHKIDPHNPEYLK